MTIFNKLRRFTTKNPLSCLIPLLSASALILPPLAHTVAQSTTPPAVTCSDQYLPVALAPGESAQYQVYGQLCSLPGLEERTVQVLVSGNTYNTTYWDFPFRPERYSYAKAMNQVGYATFNIDRIGIGKSSRPPANQVTVQSNGYVLNQVNQALRNGAIKGIKFKRIINVGHSFGSFTVIEAVSQYGGVDGVILTGFLHNINPAYPPIISSSIYPAQNEAKFQNVPAGYLTTIPGKRGVFYNQSNTDPEVIDTDEQTKDTLTTGELETAIPAILSDKSKQIKVPVLLAIGSKDLPFCSMNLCDSANNISIHEAPFFAPEAKLEVFLLNNAGHNINLDLDAPSWFQKAREWSARIQGTTSN